MLLKAAFSSTWTNVLHAGATPLPLSDCSHLPHHIMYWMYTLISHYSQVIVPMLAAESSWTPAEDAALASLATSKAYLNPEAVAEALPARSPIAAAARWAALTRSRSRHAEHSPASHTWAAVEDAVLLRERGVHGMCTWNSSAKHTPLRLSAARAYAWGSLLLATQVHT